MGKEDSNGSLSIKDALLMYCYHIINKNCYVLLEIRDAAGVAVASLVSGRLLGLTTFEVRLV